MVMKAATDLVVEFPKTEFVARTSDIANFDDTAALWADLAVTGVSVDVLVLNAASMGPSEPIISADVDDLWSEFITNVRSQFAFAHHDADLSLPYNIEPRVPRLRRYAHAGHGRGDAGLFSGPRRSASCSCKQLPTPPTLRSSR
ncbi:hypothetical protein VD0004_g7695 [Verticillium dahliae]|nr:hypothetical protein VD0004_g7695 [Verticillium dahliae]PNH68206.1 hypothetical protein VD0001_g7562 [Verticillium dahliae]